MYLGTKCLSETDSENSVNSQSEFFWISLQMNSQNIKIYINEIKYFFNSSVAIQNSDCLPENLVFYMHENLKIFLNGSS